MQVAKKLGGVFNVAPRVQHLLRGGKILAVEVMIDLHATHIYELSALTPGCLEGLHGGHRVLREVGFALNVERPRVEATLASGFRQADGVQDPFWYLIFGSSRLYFLFARA